MASVTGEAGAAPLNEDGSGPTHKIGFLPQLVGTAFGRPADGLAMRLDREQNAFHLIILDEGNAPLLSLGPYPEEDVVAEWRRLGASSGLTLKIQLPNGALMSPYPQIGRVLLGATNFRRRHGLLNHRRPRFLTRRKTGSLPLRPQVHRKSELAESDR